MRKILFALIVMAMGGFAFAGATPASAMSAGAVTGLSDLVQTDTTAEKVTWVRRCWWSYGRRYCRTVWRPGYYGYRPYYRRHWRPHRHWRHHRRWRHY